MRLEVFQTFREYAEESNLFAYEQITQELDRKIEKHIAKIKNRTASAFPPKCQKAKNRCFTHYPYAML